MKLRFNRRLSTMAQADLIPMIDVVFQLVIFFMLSSTFIQTPGISLVLPASTSAEAVVMNRMVITVLDRDEVYLNKDRYDIDGLKGVMDSMSEENREAVQSVVLEGDEAVSYSLLVEVLDILRANGFKGVNLRVREP